MSANQDLIEAEYGLIKCLENNDATYSKGKYVDQKNLIKNNIPEEAIIEMHNERIILNVCAPCFSRLPTLPPIPERKPKYGETILPTGYTLIDLSIPSVALYGQISSSSAKKDMIGEHLKAVQENLKRNTFYSLMSNRDERLEKARLQRGYSPRERIWNAKAVIEGADLDDGLRPKYEERILNLKECTSVADRILNGIAGGKLILRTADDKPILSREDIANLSVIYGDISPHGIDFKKISSLSDGLARIEDLRELLQEYQLEKEDINAILGVPLGKLPTAWIEVK